jgi:hypothetical protein
MSRRERFIAPSDEELEKLHQAWLAEQALMERRRQIVTNAIRRQRKDSLIDLLTKLYNTNIHARWSI